MSTLEIIYLICFFLGLGFAIICGLLAGVFSGGAEGAGHVDVSGGHVDVGGHPVAPGESVPLSPVNPITIAMFVATFGGSGILFQRLGLDPLVQILLAGASAFAVGAGSFYFFFKVMGVFEVTSVSQQEEAVGLEAEVITAIPADGVGQIAYNVRESRLTGTARTADGKPLPANAVVKITKIVGAILIVEKSK